MIATARPPSSNRLVGIALVAVLHLALVYLLVNGLAFRRVAVAQRPIETNIVAPPPEAHVVPPPPPPPAFAPPPPIFVPPPEVKIATPPPPPKSTAITNVTPVRPPEPALVVAPRVAPRVAVTVPPHVALGACNPDYPPASRRLGEEGTVVLQALVDPRGRAAAAKVVQSSGSSRLDQAAVDGVESVCRFAPGTVDGVAQPMWFTFKFTWKLE